MESSREPRRIRMKMDNQSFLSTYGIVLAFVLLCLVISIFTSGTFLNIANVINVLRQVSINGILAIGITFVVLTGGIDLSVGAVVALTGMIVADLFNRGVGLIPALLAGMVAGAAIGSVSGYFIARYDLAPFVVTLGVQTIARGLTYIYSDGKPISQFADGFIQLGKGSFLGLPIPVWVLLLTFLVSFFILNKTKMGRFIYAVGGNEKATLYSGVKVAGVKLFVYAFNGALCGLAAAVLTSRVSAALPQAGAAYESDAIAAVVIGGTSLSGGKGRLWGTIVGVLIIGVIGNGLDLLRVSSYIQQIVKGSIIIGAILFDKVSNTHK